MTEPKTGWWRGRRAERITKVGPVELWGVRRQPDDPLLRDLAAYRKAWEDLGAALLDTPPGRLLARWVEWLNAKLEKRP